MAVVKSFSAEMVRDFAGVVDFYYWKGIPVARRWPRKTTILPSSAMWAARTAFIQSRRDLALMPGAVREAWASVSFGKKQAWLDYYTAIYMRYFKLYRVYPPVVLAFERISG
jgi:hypothetical protein